MYDLAMDERRNPDNNQIIWRGKPMGRASGFKAISTVRAANQKRSGDLTLSRGGRDCG